jgi:hypothetical protein
MRCSVRVFAALQILVAAAFATSARAAEDDFDGKTYTLRVSNVRLQDNAHYTASISFRRDRGTITVEIDGRSASRVDLRADGTVYIEYPRGDGRTFQLRLKRDGNEIRGTLTIPWRNYPSRLADYDAILE